MGISVKTRKMLWGRAASRCNEPTCRLELVMDITETDDPTLVGEECHVVAREPGGPRGDSPLSTEQRDLYGNLLLMCNVHHTVIDRNPIVYPVDRLHRMKSDHEAWVRASLAGYDPVHQREEELYASCIQEWETRLDLDGWDGWAGRLLSHGHPSLPVWKLEALEWLRAWLFKRVWPRRYPRLEAALENFRLVLVDLTNWMQKVGEEVGVGDTKTIWVEKIYKRARGVDRLEERRLEDEYDFNVGVAEDLALELTRAANLVCDEVRRDLMPDYRLKEGLVVITSGPFADLTWTTYKPQYAMGTTPDGAYPGLTAFLADREDRDISAGYGVSAEDYARRKRERRRD